MEILDPTEGFPGFQTKRRSSHSRGRSDKWTERGGDDSLSHDELQEEMDALIKTPELPWGRSELKSAADFHLQVRIRRRGVTMNTERRHKMDEWASPIHSN